MRNIVKKIDIDKEYTRIIRLYADNYRIDTTAMGGTQGEVAKMDFAGADGTVFRVMMDRGYEKTDRYNDTDTISIRIYKFNNRNRRETLWNEDGQIIYERIWYNVDRYRRDDAWTENFNEAVNCINKGWNRPTNADVVYRQIDSPKMIKIIVKMIKNTKGYKTIKADDISKVYTENGKYYRVYFKNNVKPAWTKYMK